MKNHLNLPLRDFSDAEREAVDNLLYELQEELELLLFPIRTMLEAGVVVLGRTVLCLDKESSQNVRLCVFPQTEGSKTVTVDIRLQHCISGSATLEYTISVYVGHKTVEEVE